jgi:hypothetical protein
VQVVRDIVQELPPVMVDCLGQWQGVVNNLLRIGTAASEVGLYARSLR